MTPRTTCLMIFALFPALLHTARISQDVGDEEYDSLDAGGATGDFCASDRCDGATDKDGKSKIELQFRVEIAGNDTDDENVVFSTMHRDDVAVQKGHVGYHHGRLHKCKPVTGHFSYRRDWATHMHLNMREGIWPNQPGDMPYTCAEHCRLQVFDASGNQLNKNNEQEVWVERAGHSTDVLAKLPGLGWKPKHCTVGTALQQHWWKQASEKSSDDLMVDQAGLPVWPFASHVDKPLNWVAPLEEKYKLAFCALTDDQKVSVVQRVTRHRLDHRSYGTSYGAAVRKLRARNYFPEHFPLECEDGWTRDTAQGVVHYEGELSRSSS